MSPEAQAVYDAFNKDWPDGLIPALRAAGDILREAYANEESIESPDDFLYDIANEIEAIHV